MTFITVNFAFEYWTDFNCCGSFVLSLVDGITTGAKHFVLFIAKDVALSTSQIRQFSGEVNFTID